MSRLILNTDTTGSSTFGFYHVRTARSVISRVLKSEGHSFDAEVSLSIVGPEEIRELNAAYREIDRETDVLSFPSMSLESPDDLTEEALSSASDPDTGTVFLGDIVINRERVFSQAEEYGHSVRREFAFLVAHSMLHLLGYDHETGEEAAVMEARQEAVLESLGITRDAASL